jgi:hypothetical protein
MTKEIHLWYTAVKVLTLSEIYIPKKPTLFWIEDSLHCIAVFPSAEIFDCHPQLLQKEYCSFESVFKVNTETIELEVEDYVKFWDNCIDEEPEIQNDQNCVFWSAYYIQFCTQTGKGLVDFLNEIKSYPLEKLAQFVKSLPSC